MKFNYLSFGLIVWIVLMSCSSGNIRYENVERGFVKTPDSIQTSVYWYWISNHISEEGVIKDLQSMKKIGINRAFIGNIGLDDKESGVGPVKFYSDEWWKVIHAALKTASELGIDIGIFNCPGWSQSGGPWVKPGQSMRYLADTLVEVEGGRVVDRYLPRPESKWKDDFQDVKVLAYPMIAESKLNLNNSSVSSGSLSHPEYLMDGNLDSQVKLFSPLAKDSIVTVDFVAKNPFLLKSLTIYPAKNPIDCSALIQVEKDGHYQTLENFSISRFNPALNVGFNPYAPIVISLNPTLSSKFRLAFIRPNQGSGIREVVFSSNPVVERYPEKTLAKMYQTPLPYWNEYMWREEPDSEDTASVIKSSQIMDISDCLKGDRLIWKAPVGEWVIMRTGMLPTGVTNSPARPEATGLETDKMSKKHIASHFESFLGEIYRRIPAADRKSWKFVVEDSYETGGQNFTDGFLDEFKQRYGYDPVPFLPVFGGVVVDNQNVSDRFLWDVRRLVADKVSYDYVAGLREISHRYGLTTWLENYGHWGFPGEFLQYGGQSDEIAGEFWSEGSLGNIENRAASSCGHIYGKNKISAESFTAGGGGFHRYPAVMKQRGDRFFTEGINNTLLHLYISQPYEDKEPGVNATFGNEFNRKNTWFPQLDLFISYLKRVNFMLQLGKNVADVAYFIGEDTPKMTGVMDPPLPKGYQFDYINSEVIEKYLSVKDGILILPSGARYRMLVLPKEETMRPGLLRKIRDLIHEGAVVMGPPPLRSPSLQNFPQADSEVRALSDSLWSGMDSSKKYRRIGNGCLINGLTMEAAMKLIACVPDCELSDKDSILYCHRKLQDADIYFLSNQSSGSVSIFPIFRTKGKRPEVWNAVDGSVRVLPAFQFTENGTQVPIKMERNESLFIVFRNPIKKQLKSQDGEKEMAYNFPSYSEIKTLEGPWSLSFDKNRRGPAEPLVVDKLFDITQSKDDDIRHYSGTIVYENKFNMGVLPKGRVCLNLHDVMVMAKVFINDKYVGGVWTDPYRVDITNAVKKGENTVRIEVVTTWKNRLIGDLNLPEKERRTWVAYQPWTAKDELQRSGLIGPVTIENVDYKQRSNK